MSSTTCLLVHGGLAEAMDARRFWVDPGVVDGLRAAGFTVIAPDRDTTPTSWVAAADDAAAAITDPSVVIAGSNGVSVALRLALDAPRLVERLVLAWPATAGDPSVDALVPPDASHLTSGGTIRGVTDEELATLTMPVGVMASRPENRFHRRHTVDGLLGLLPGAVELRPPTAEPLRAEFVLGDFLRAVMPCVGGRRP
jgi:pimeloyl-ACP methyl ester carboxylesterase